MKNKIKFFLGILISSIMLSATFAAEDELKALDISLINQNPDPVYAGDVFEVTIGIENMGYGTIDNVILEIEENYPFSLVSASDIEIDNVYSSDEYTTTEKIKLKVEAGTLAGEYNLIINQIDGNSVIEHLIPINVASNKNIEIVSIDKNSIIPGAIENISFIIKNVGSTNLRNIEFSWEDEDNVILPVNGDNKVFIDKLSSNEEKEVFFTISSSNLVDADLYQIDISLSYENTKTSEITTESSNTGIYVGGETQFDIILDEISSEEYVFSIANIGANDATSVKVSLSKENKMDDIIKTAEIIGDLNKGDYTTLSFEISNLIGNLILDIDYTDTAGNRVSDSKVIEISSTSNTNSTFGGNRGMIASGDFPQGGMGGGPMSGVTSGISTLKSWLIYLGYGIVGVLILFFGFKTLRKRKAKSSK